MNMALRKSLVTLLEVYMCYGGIALLIFSADADTTMNSDKVLNAIWCRSYSHQINM